MMEVNIANNTGESPTFEELLNDVPKCKGIVETHFKLRDQLINSGNRRLEIRTFDSNLHNIDIGEALDLKSTDNNPRQIRRLLSNYHYIENATGYIQERYGNGFWELCKNENMFVSDLENSGGYHIFADDVHIITFPLDEESRDSNTGGFIQPDHVFYEALAVHELWHMVIAELLEYGSENTLMKRLVVPYTNSAYNVISEATCIIHELDYLYSVDKTRYKKKVEQFDEIKASFHTNLIYKEYDPSTDYQARYGMALTIIPHLYKAGWKAGNLHQLVLRAKDFANSQGITTLHNIPASTDPTSKHQELMDEILKGPNSR